jgi:hypothetical protein
MRDRELTTKIQRKFGKLEPLIQRLKNNTGEQIELRAGTAEPDRINSGRAPSAAKK